MIMAYCFLKIVDFIELALEYCQHRINFQMHLDKTDANQEMSKASSARDDLQEHQSYFSSISNELLHHCSFLARIKYKSVPL